jgi:hypothetical protein
VGRPRYVLLSVAASQLIAHSGAVRSSTWRVAIRSDEEGKVTLVTSQYELWVCDFLHPEVGVMMTNSCP